MIKRFRVEGYIEGNSSENKETLSDELSCAVSTIIGGIKEEFGQNGPWECMDDVISAVRQPPLIPGHDTLVTGYRGRLVMTYRGEE